CLQGKAHNEGAQQLGLSLPTFRGRLERARELLRKRLTRRGVALSGALLATFLSGTAASADLSPTLVISTVKAVLVGDTIASATVSAKALSLAKGVIDVMFWKKSTLAAILFVLTAIALGTLGLAVAGHAQINAQQDHGLTAQGPTEPAPAVEGNL